MFRKIQAVSFIYLAVAYYIGLAFLTYETIQFDPFHRGFQQGERICVHGFVIIRFGNL